MTVAPPPSLDRARPNPQGGGRAIGEQTHKPRRPSTAREAPPATPAAQRRELLAIARDRILELPTTDERRELWERLEDAWRGCGWSTLFRNPATGTVVGLPDHCDRILCGYCELRRVGRIRDRYRARHDEALGERRLYLATLTIPNVPRGQLAEAYRQLRAAISKLRRRRWWDENVPGGIWRLETTVNLKTRTWHPHVNVLFETDEPIPMREWQPAIQREWRRVAPRFVDGAWRVGADDGSWIWLVPGWKGAIAETVKRQVAAARGGVELEERDAMSSIDYTVKPDPHWIRADDPVWVVEYVEALAGARTVSSFGEWRGMPKPPADPPAEELVEAPYAYDGDWFAKRWLPALDPLTSTRVAEWEWAGRGPRAALRPHKPPGEDRGEWLVWHARDGTENPADVDDVAPWQYQAPLPLAGSHA